MSENNIWLNGIMGLVVGDALGVPSEFKYREELKNHPISSMNGYGTYNQPAGTWSDDSSMTLATLDSLIDGYNPNDIMEKFIAWYKDEEYTPYGELFDIGMSTEAALRKYITNKDIYTCGGASVADNGNGSLMRILPICLYCVDKDMQTDKAISIVHEVSALTHAHIRSKMACGLYYFIVKSIIKNKGTFKACIQSALEKGFKYYENDTLSYNELSYYKRLCNLTDFQNLHENEILSGGYVVESFEAAIWCLLNSDSYKECELKAVNLGNDTDTIAAIAGGLAGLYYGYDTIPTEWLKEIAKLDWIKKKCFKLEHI